MTAAPPSGPGPAPKRLLVVEDDESLRELLVVSMKAEGFEVAAARDGAKGLELLGSWKPHIVLLDLMMPNVNGFQFIGTLSQRGVRVPIVVMTGFWEQADEGLLRQDPNVVEFLRKPVKYAELAAVMRRVLA